MTRILFAVSAVVLLIFSFPAKADTTVFAANVADAAGPVANAGAALGAADGASALIQTGGALTLAFDQPFEGGAVTLTTASNGLIAFGAVAVGEVVNGVAVFSTEIGFNTLFDNTHNFDFSSRCAAISTVGCSLLRIRTTGTILSSGIALDGVSAVSAAPEPAQWALMMLAFLLVAGRLKAHRAAAPAVVYLKARALA